MTAVILKYAKILVGVSEGDMEDDIIVEGVGVLCGDKGPSLTPSIIVSYSISPSKTPNNIFDVYYDSMVVMAYYENQRFIMENFSHVVYQGRRNTTHLTLSLKREKDMDNTIGVVEEGHHQERLDSEVEQKQQQCRCDNNGDERYKKSGYDILVRFYLETTAMPNPKSFVRMNWMGNSQFTCNLKRVPLITASNYNPSSFMNIVKCNTDFYRVFHPPGSG
ncbi:hypothetical protein ACLB2K_070896 [Fragaria x ananassa]